ncbi:glycoside hydrolase family 2 TIM barrel-domain containing protein [Spirosoma arcticum]
MTTYSNQCQLVAWSLCSLLGLFGGCQETNRTQPTTVNAAAPTTVRFNGTSYELLRHGKPYFIKGGGGVSHFEELKACGGNSIRVWDDIDAGQILDEAQTLGLTVMFGLWVEREMEGFDYDNQAAVEQQYERIRKTVLRYRNHPALLLWSVGNEWALEANNFKVYDEVNRLSKLVHGLDPNHPVSTAISPDSKRAIRLVSQRCSNVDILAVNSYSMTKQLNEFFQEGGWTKPYLISEYGAPGYWEVPLAPWGAPDEPDSQRKLTAVRQFYQQHVRAHPPNCFGAYLFYWGHKQEETHTWLSAFDEQGRQTPLVGLMQELWSGKRPANLAPVMERLLIDRQAIAHRSFNASTALHQAEIRVTDPDGDSLTYNWELKPRAQQGTDYVGVPRLAMQGLLLCTDKPTITFRLPPKPGPYRLFVNVYDTHRHVATANFSFEVSQTKQPD